MVQRKLALFVEGQTELIFIKRLLLELAGSKDISFSERSTNSLITLTSNNIDDGTKYFVLLVDCRGDEAVKSKILENRENLIGQNYELVIGLRDVYPLDKSDIPSLELGLKTGVPTKDIRIEICLAQMEVEAWFLQEQSHYQKIDGNLTDNAIYNGTGFNPQIDNAEDVEHPSDLLKSIYQLVGKSYNKKWNNIQRTVGVLDYEELYLTVQYRLPYFRKFLKLIDTFIT